jgi:hypothetical protein
VVDFVESAVLGDTMGAISELVSKIPVVGEVTSVVLDLSAAVMNTEPTDGWKQHLLRAEDANQITTIEIKLDEIKFNSKSGISATGVKKGKPPKK